MTNSHWQFAKLGQLDWHRETSLFYEANRKTETDTQTSNCINKMQGKARQSWEVKKWNMD